MKAGDATAVKLKSGRCIEVTCPCMVILPSKSPVRATVFHLILLEDGEIIHKRAPESPST